MAQQDTTDARTELETTISIKWTGDARQKMSSRGVMPAYEDGCDWAARCRDLLNEYASLVKLRTQQDVADFLQGLNRVRSREPQTCTWMTGAHGRAYDRVYSEVLEAVQEQGADVDASGLGSPTIEWPQDEDDEDEQEDTAARAGDLLERAPAEYGYTAKLQMTETQVAVVEAALEAPSATQETVARVADCTERYANSTLNRWRGTEDETDAVDADVAPCYQDVA